MPPWRASPTISGSRRTRRSTRCGHASQRQGQRLRISSGPQASRTGSVRSSWMLPAASLTNSLSLGWWGMSSLTPPTAALLWWVHWPRRARPTWKTTLWCGSDLKRRNFSLDQRDPGRHWPGWDFDQLESEFAVGLFMDLLEDQRMLESDTPCLGRRNETETAHEEDARGIHLLSHDPVHLGGQQRRHRRAQKPAEGK